MPASAVVESPEAIEDHKKVVTTHSEPLYCWVMKICPD